MATRMMYNAAKSNTPIRRSVVLPEPELDMPIIVRTKATIPTMCKILKTKECCRSPLGPSVLTKGQSTDEDAIVTSNAHKISNNPRVVKSKGDKPDASRA